MLTPSLFCFDICRAFSELGVAFQTTQQMAKKKMSAKLQRTLDAIDPNIVPTDMQEKMDDTELQTMFQQVMLASPSHMAARAVSTPVMIYNEFASSCNIAMITG